MSRIKGMTLLELLLAASLVGLVSLTFAAIYGSATRYFIQDVNLTSTQGEAGYIMQHIQRNVTAATRLVNSDTGNPAPWAGSVAFLVDTANPVVLPNDPTDDVWRAYRLNGANLLYIPNVGVASALSPTETQVNAAPNQEIIARGVSPTGATPIFQITTAVNLSPLLRVSLTTTQGTGANQKTSSISSSFSPRGANPNP